MEENTTSTIQVTKNINNSNKKIQPIKIIDFDMPFLSMIIFMIKLAIASIPAVVVFLFIVTLLTILFFSIFGSIMLSTFSQF